MEVSGGNRLQYVEFYCLGTFFSEDNLMHLHGRVGESKQTRKTAAEREPESGAGSISPHGQKVAPVVLYHLICDTKGEGDITGLA